MEANAIPARISFTGFTSAAGAMPSGKKRIRRLGDERSAKRSDRELPFGGMGHGQLVTGEGITEAIDRWLPGTARSQVRHCCGAPAIPEGGQEFSPGVKPCNSAVAGVAAPQGRREDVAADCAAGWFCAPIAAAIHRGPPGRGNLRGAISQGSSPRPCRVLNPGLRSSLPYRKRLKSAC